MTKYTCDKCWVFACPIVMKSKKPVFGCNVGEDLMNQIKAGMKSRKSKNFEKVCMELGLEVVSHD